MSGRIYLRGPDRKRLGEIDDYRSLTFTEKHAGVGSWSLELWPKVGLAPFMEPGTGIIVLPDDDQPFSGPIRGRKRSKDEKGETLVVTGYDDSVWLNGRWVQPCIPNYSTAPHVYTASEYDTQTAPAETVIKHYLSLALGSSATGNRQLPGLVIAADQQRGLVVTEQARFDVLADLVASAALAGGDLGYGVRQWVEGHAKTDLVFDVAIPRDLTRTAKFSIGLGNLASYDYEQNAPDANAILVAAGGEGVDRLTYEHADIDSVLAWGRIEGPLRDRRDTEDTGQMAQTATEELSKAAQKLAINFTVSDTERLKYGRDWRVSDRVTVEIDGVAFSEIVREATRTWKPGAPGEVAAVIGTPEATGPNVLRIFAAQRNTAARIGRIESRQ